MTRDWTYEEFKDKEGNMTEECRLITKEEWDEYQVMRGMMKDMYKCLTDIVNAGSWEEAHDLAEGMLNMLHGGFDPVEEEK